MTELLSKRETEALLLLGCYRYLGRSQLQEFLLSDSLVTTLSREVIGKRIVGSLREKGLLGATKRLVGGPGGGSTRLGYFLTGSGIRLARSLNPDLPPRRPTGDGTFLMQHALMTADVALAFRRTARSQPGHELLDWECDWQARQRLGLSVLVPDAYFVYATTDLELAAFLEVDLGTEGTRFFVGKVRRYLDLYRSGGWRERLASWPLILVVTPTDRRTQLLLTATRKLVADQKLQGQVELAFCSLPELLAESPLAKVWRISAKAEPQALLAEAHSGQVVD